MPREYLEPDGTFSHATVVDHETRQLKKLRAQGVTDEKDLAHRLATSVRAVRKMLKHLGE